MPYDRPSEQSIAIGGVGRLDTARWFAQAELAYNATFIKGDYAPDSTVPSRWMLLAGAGYRPARSLAVVVTLLGQRRVNNHYPASALVLGAGLDLAVPRGAVSLRAEQRVEDCHLGTWVPSRDHTARCSRVAVDYTLRF
jgi:hypothetical protein